MTPSRASSTWNDTAAGPSRALPCAWPSESSHSPRRFAQLPDRPGGQPLTDRLRSLTVFGQTRLGDSVTAMASRSGNPHLALWTAASGLSHGEIARRIAVVGK